MNLRLSHVVDQAMMVDSNNSNDDAIGTDIAIYPSCIWLSSRCEVPHIQDPEQYDPIPELLALLDTGLFQEILSVESHTAGASG